VALKNVAVFWLGALAVLGVARSARAEQFVLLDATFDYTWDDAVNSKPSKSHYYVNDENFLNGARPKNWQSPIDYRNGTVHVRAEVLKKPAGDQQVGWTLCYIANAGEYGCADSAYYGATGVFEKDSKMTDFWQNETIEWDQGIKQMDLIYTINDSGSGHVSNFPELKELTTPTRVRITMVQVSAGATYDPSIIDTMSGAGGSGASSGGSGASGGAGGASLGGGGNGGAPETSGGGNGGVASASAGTFANAGSTNNTSAGMTAVAGQGTGPSAPAAPSTDAGCSTTPASRGLAGLSAGLAMLAALALARRTQRLLRR
jgi:uncharacterized membrane protein YgcG